MNKEKFYVISGCNCNSEYDHRENIKCLVPVEEIKAKKEFIEDSISFLKYRESEGNPEVSFTMRFYFYNGKDDEELFDGSIHNEVLDNAQSGEIVEMSYKDILEDIQCSEEGFVTVEHLGSINFKKTDDLTGDEYFTEHHTTLEMILRD